MAGVDEFLQGAKENFDVLIVQASGRFVEDEEGGFWFLVGFAVGASELREVTD